MLLRVLASKWMRSGLLAIILAFCCYVLATEWPKVRPTLGQMHVYSLAGSFVAAMLASGCMMLAWRAILADLGSDLPPSVTARITFLSQLGKYVPGAIWSFAAHVELGHDYQVPRRRGAASVIVAMAIAVVAGVLIAAVLLPLASPDLARRYMLVLAVAPFIAVCLTPPILHRVLNLALRLIKHEPLEQPVSWRGFGVALAWTMLGWLMFGLQVWAPLADVTRADGHTFSLALGAYAFACSMALLLVVFPSGIGAREALLVAALAPVLPAGPALAVALAARLVTTASDLAWASVVLIAGSTVSAKIMAPAKFAAPARIAALRGRGRHRKSSKLGLRPAPPEQTGGIPAIAAQASPGQEA